MKMSDVLLPPYEVVDDDSGWSVIHDKEGNPIDASCDGGFNREDAEAIAHAINCHDDLVDAVDVLLNHPEVADYGAICELLTRAKGEL